MSRLKALGKESLIYGVSSILSRFLNFLLVPFYTHVLTTAEFGVSYIIFAFLAFLNIVYQFGLDSAYLRLGADAEGDARRKIFSSAFWSQAALMGCLSIGLYFLFPSLGRAFLVPDEYHPLLTIAIGILILDTLTVTPFAHLRLTHKAWAYASIRLGNVLINVGANLYLVLVLKMGLMGIFLANLLASGVTLALLLPVIVSQLRLRWSKPEMRALLLFGLPLVPAGLYGIVNEMAGRLFLKMLGPDDIARLYPGSGYTVLELTGIFSAAWKLGVFGLLLVQMYRMAWQPFFLQRYKDADAPQLFGRVLRVLTLFVCGASIALMLFLDKLVALEFFGRNLIHRDFWPGLEIVPAVLLSYAFQAWFVHFTLGVYIAKQTRYLIWCNGVGAAITVAGNFLLVPRFGLWGAVLAANFCYLVMAFMLYRRSQRLFPIAVEWRKMAPVLIWAGLGWTLGTAIQIDPSLLGWLGRIGALALFIVIPFVLGGISRAERGQLLSMLGSKRS